LLFAIGTAVTPLAEASREHASLIRFGSLAMVALVAVPLVILVLASAGRGRIEARIRGWRGARAWIGRSLLSLAQGIDAFRHPALVTRIAFHTAAAWLMIAAATWLGVRACGADVSFGAVLVLLPLLVLGIALPTPGGAGGYHAAMTFGLTRLYDVPQPVAVGTSLLMHLAIVLPVMIAGGVFLVVDRVSFRDVLRVGRTFGAADGAPGERRS
jgi:uncharacterized membrane protein YbhN (UPF0104 family)